MWRILDDPALPGEWHQQLFAFVLANWTTFNNVSLKFLGDRETVVLEVLKRLQDRSSPPSKRFCWPPG